MAKPRFLIEKLIAYGMKEPEITEALKESGVDITQATLNRIKNGVIKRTSFEIGMGLVELVDRESKRTGSPRGRQTDCPDHARSIDHFASSTVQPTPSRRNVAKASSQKKLLNDISAPLRAEPRTRARSGAV